jgi:hypothetical protein
MITLNNIKKKTRILFIIMLLVAATNDARSQPLDEPDPQPVPFDGGATILIASGVAYGAKKYKENKAKKN